VADQWTSPLARSYCPGCEPDADPTVDILEVRWCEEHALSTASPDDVRVTPEIMGLNEAGGETNRMWCAAIHRPGG